MPNENVVEILRSVLRLGNKAGPYLPISLESQIFDESIANVNYFFANNDLDPAIIQNFLSLFSGIETMVEKMENQTIIMNNHSHIVNFDIPNDGF